MIKCFVAVGIGDHVKSELESVQLILKKTYADVRWSSLVNVHLTLCFLGDMPEEKIDGISLALENCSRDVGRFGFSVKGLGTFGKRHSPRVVWAGVEDADSLRLLQRKTAESLRGIGIPLEDREFRPHLTLGRVRSLRGGQDLMKAVEYHANRDFGEVTAGSFVLMKSVISPQGAEHFVVRKFELK